MNCRKCGNLLNENDSFCTVCGEPVVAPTMNQQMGGQFGNQGQMSQTISPTETLQPSPGVMPQGMSNQSMQQPMMNQTMNNPQPEMMQQPMMNQPVNNMQPMNNMPQNNNGMNQGGSMLPKKNNSSFMIIVIILLVVILGLGCFVGYKLINKDDTKVEEKDNTKNKTDNKKDNKDDDKDKDNDKDDDKENEEEEEDKEPIIADNTNTFESEGYKFIIPNGLKYKINDDYDYKFLLFSNGSTFSGNMVLSKYDSTSILEETDKYKEVLQRSGYTVQDSAYLLVGGVAYNFYQTYYNNKPLLYYITRLENNIYLEGAMQATESTGFNTGMEYVSKMIKSVEKISNFLPSDETTGSTGPTKPTFIEEVNIEGVEYPIN